MSHAPSAPITAFAPSPDRVRLLRKVHGAGQRLGMVLWPAIFLGFALLADRYQRSLPDADQVHLSLLTHTPPPTEAGNIGLPGYLLMLLLSLGLLMGLACYYANKSALNALCEDSNK